jgi:hypothetical protein
MNIVMVALLFSTQLFTGATIVNFAFHDEQLGLFFGVWERM